MQRRAGFLGVVPGLLVDARRRERTRRKSATHVTMRDRARAHEGAKNRLSDGSPGCRPMVSRESDKR